MFFSLSVLFQFLYGPGPIALIFILLILLNKGTHLS